MELISILLPILIDFINRKFSDSDVRLGISLLVCGAFGAFFNYMDTGFVFENMRAGFESLSASIMMTFGLAQLSFKAFWEKTDMHRDMRAEANK